MLALIMVGFVMATLGVALLFLGEVPFVRGKRIPARRARIIGIALVSFLPLALGMTQLLNYLFGRESINGLAVTWSIFGGCWLVVAVSLFRIMVPKKPSRPAEASLSQAAPMDSFGAAGLQAEPMEEANPFPEPEPARELPGKKSVPGKQASAQKTRKPAVEENNPFDFT